MQKQQMTIPTIVLTETHGVATRVKASSPCLAADSRRSFEGLLAVAAICAGFWGAVIAIL